MLKYLAIVGRETLTIEISKNPIKDAREMIMMVNFWLFLKFSRIYIPPCIRI
jgi:hypothetical protein